MMNFQNIILQGLIKLGLIQKPDFIAKIVSQHPTPEQIKSGQIFIVRDSGLWKWACFQCPACGETILLSLSQVRHPRWKVTLDCLNRPTLHPSIRQTDGQKCHFWIRKGKVRWCHDFPHNL
jgi:predicted RNA-binding Zn-ribbon protein involved in translation (DUF1610 family)